MYGQQAQGDHGGGNHGSCNQPSIKAGANHQARRNGSRIQRQRHARQGRPHCG
jgi:hypothetical protein